MNLYLYGFLLVIFAISLFFVVNIIISNTAKQYFSENKIPFIGLLSSILLSYIIHKFYLKKFLVSRTKNNYGFLLVIFAISIFFIVNIIISITAKQYFIEIPFIGLLSSILLSYIIHKFYLKKKLLISTTKNN